MEFDRTCAKVQGILLSNKKTEGALNTITYDEKRKRLESASKNIHKSFESLDHKEENLRKITIFLFLNSNFSSCDHLKEDEYCGHLVECAPVISKELFVELVTIPPLNKYFFEIISYCPFYIVNELIKNLLIKINKHSKDPTDLCINLFKAIYIKYLRIEKSWETYKNSKCVKNKLKYFFRMAINDLKSTMETNSEIESFHAYILKHLPKIYKTANECLSFNWETHKDTPVIYSFGFSYDNSSMMKTQEISEDIHFELLGLLKKIVSLVSFDLWPNWEVGVDEDGINLQRKFGELNYKTKELIKNLYKNPPLEVENVLVMLNSISIRPFDEDDEIKSADLETIKTNINKEGKTSNKWFKALLSHDLTLESTRNCITQNIHMLEYEDMELILSKTLDIIKTKNDDINSIIAMALNALKQLSIDHQIKIMFNYTKKYGITSQLRLDDYEKLEIEIFNKTIDFREDSDSDAYQELYTNCIHLTMQSPEECLTRILFEGIKSSKQIKVVLLLLNIVEIIALQNYKDVICQEKQEKMNYLTFLILKIQNESVKTDSEKGNFLKLLTAIINDGPLYPNTYLKAGIFPEVTESLVKSDWEKLLFSLQILELFVSGKITKEIHLNDLNDAALSVLLLQILEKARWGIDTFTPMLVIVCEKTMILLETVLDRFLLDRSPEDKEVLWLQSRLNEGFQSNMFYFGRTWNKYQIRIPKALDLLLVNIMYYVDHREEGITNSLNLLPKDQNSIECTLVQILPISTPSEWKVAYMCLVDGDRNGLGQPYQARAQIACDRFFAALTTLEMIIAQDFLASEKINVEPVLACFEYCIRTFSSLLLNQVVPHISEGSDGAVLIFCKLAKLLARIPLEIRKEASNSSVNVLISLINLAFGEKSSSDNREELTKAIILLKDIPIHQLLASKMLQFSTNVVESLKSTD